MPFNHYFQDELSYLRELGAEFADAYPKLAPFLGSSGGDPDVERLLEGFAFLSGRLRQKLDDELPELSHSLIRLLWPHYLRPLPSFSIVEFAARDEGVINATKTIPRGTELLSTPVDGTPCRFRTTDAVELQPLRLDHLELHHNGVTSTLVLTLRLHGIRYLEQLELSRLRLHLCGDAFVSNTLYLWLLRHLESIEVRPIGGQTAFSLPSTSLQGEGFADHQALLPYPPNAFNGFRLLQEYFAFPQKFLFTTIDGLDRVSTLESEEGFELAFRFNRPLAESLRVKREHVRLYCAPVVNLFSHDATPIRLDHRRNEYRVVPSGADGHFEVFDIESVVGVVQGSGRRRTYHRFESFEHEIGGRDPVYYRSRLRPATVGQGIDHYLAFVGNDERPRIPPTESVSLELICSNRNLPERLAVGDISHRTESSPEFASFRNITVPTPSLSPPLEEGLLWQLVSNVAVNYLSITDPQALRTILRCYDFRAHHDRRAEREGTLRLQGLKRIESVPADRLFRGLPVRGMRTRMTLIEDHFSGEGDLYLFATLLDEFLALYASVNSFHQLEVIGAEHGEHYRWPARIGRQPLL